MQNLRMFPLLKDIFYGQNFLEAGAEAGLFFGGGGKEKIGC